MATSTGIEIVGVLNAKPASTSFGSCSAQGLLPLNTQAVYAAAKGAEISVASTDVAPFNVPLEGIVAVRLFAMRVQVGTTIKALITTSAGVAALPVSDELVIHNPNPGDQITAIALVGTADVAYAIAGDTT